jgi:hypothetical protein
VRAGAFDALAHQLKPLECTPLEARPSTTSPSCTSWPVRIFDFSTAPTAKPARSYSPGRVHAGHFRGLAADQRAARELAAAGDAADHGRGGVHVQLAAGEVVEEEQRLGALHQHVVDAHGHQVDADRVVHVPLEGQLELGADAVGAAHQHRLLVALGHLEQRAEAADAGQHAFAHAVFDSTPA